MPGSRRRPHDRPRADSVRVRVGAGVSPAAARSGGSSGASGARQAIVFSRVSRARGGSARRAARRRSRCSCCATSCSRRRSSRCRGRAPARTREDVTSEGINIVLAIDLSSSMLAQDFQPQNRLEVAKDVVKRFISARTSDRIGVVAFAAEALTQVPLTTDYPVVNAAVDNLAAGQLEDGTAIGTAIATAANRLRDAPGTVARDDRAHRRREQSRRDRSAHGGQGGRGVRHQDLHDRRRHRGHGAGAGGPRAVRTALRESSGADRRAAARRTSPRRRAGGTTARATPRRCSASTTRSTSSSASRCGRARTCATRSCFAGRSISRRWRWSSSSCWPRAGGRCHERNRIRLSVPARARRAPAVAGGGRASSRVPAAQGAPRAPRQHGAS